MLKRVLAIHDISCIGKCSITVALPVISAAGIECSILPTSILSTHTGGFTGYTFLDLTSELNKIKDHWKTLNINFDAFYTGYLGSIDQINLLINLISELKNEKSLYICDPVMADNGKLYPAFDLKYAKEMKKLVSYSDVVIPNITEACFILNKEYKEGFSKEEIEILLKELTDLGPNIAIITGCTFIKDKFTNFAYNKAEDKYYIYSEDKIEGYYHGTGDLISSCIVGCLVNDLDLTKTLEISTKITYKSIRKTFEDGLDKKYGVEFELFLSEYGELINKK